MKAKQTYELLAPIVSAMNKGVIGSGIIANPDSTWTITADNTKWLTKGHEITIQGFKYELISVIPNISFTFKSKDTPTVPPVVMSFDAYDPFFIHGTVISTSSEYDQKSVNSFDKLPFIWLKEVVRERVFPSTEDIIDRNSECELFFMTDCDFVNWLNTDHDQYAIQPMRNMVNEFISALNKSQFVGELVDPFDVTNHARWGTYISDKGHANQIFNDHLSGCALRITIPFLKPAGCNGTILDTRCAPAFVFDSDGNLIATLYSNDKYVVPAGTGLPVSIKDQDGNLIAQVAPGGSYTVQVFEGIQDTIVNNVTTIIDPII